MAKPITTEASKDMADAAADHGLDPSDPAVTGVPRDERHDSIDSQSGLLTDEARELRVERGIGASGETYSGDEKPAE